MIELPITVLGAIVVASSSVAILIGHYIGFRHGVIGGYGALKWPDSPYFAEARKFLNSIREWDGLPSIEEDAK